MILIWERKIMTKYNSFKMTTIGFLALASTTCAQATSQDNENPTGKEGRFTHGSPASLPTAFLSPTAFPSSPFSDHLDRKSSPVRNLFSTSSHLDQPQINPDRLVTFKTIFGDGYMDSDDRLQAMEAAIKEYTEIVKTAQANLSGAEEAEVKKQELEARVKQNQETLKARALLMASGVHSEKDLKKILKAQKKEAEKSITAFEALKEVSAHLIAPLIETQKKTLTQINYDLELLAVSPTKVQASISEDQSYITDINKLLKKATTYGEELDEKWKELKGLYQLKIQTIFDLPSDALYPQELAITILKEMGFKDDLTKVLDSQKWWVQTMKFLSLPILTPEMQSDVPSILKTSLKKMITLYGNRLKELLSLAPIVDSLVEGFNLDLAPYGHREKEIYQQFLSSNISQTMTNNHETSAKGHEIFLNIVNRTYNLGSKQALFNPLLKHLNLSTPQRHLEMLCGAISTGNQLTAQYVSRTHAFAEFSETIMDDNKSTVDFSKEYMQFMYDILALDFNKRVLETILGNLSLSDSLKDLGAPENTRGFVGL
jgi:hypothetical protein